MIWGSPRDGCPASEAQGSRALLKGVNKVFCVFRPILMKFGTGKAVLCVWAYGELHISVYRDNWRYFESKM